MNIADMLYRQAAQRPAHAAILFEGSRIAFRELADRASRLAGALSALGIGPGDRVALYLPNLPEFAIAYYAAQTLGAITVSVNAIFKREEVRHLLDDSGARLVFTTEELRPQVPLDCPALAHCIVCDAQGEGTLDALIASARDPMAPVRRHASDPAALLYSSGTTGFPKGVTLTQGNILSNVPVCAEYSGYGPEDRLAVFLPLFHVYGQNYLMNAAVHAGSTIVLFRRFVPEQVLAAIDDLRITMFFGVPTVFIAILGMDLAAYRLDSLRYEMSAAATMPEEISRRWFDRFGRRIHEGYGLTECSPFACYNDLSEHRFGSVGRAVREFEVAILDEQDRPVPTGDWGEIAIRGPGVMQGYWNRPADTEAALRGGWLHSGDIGRIDRDGYVYLVDRVKDMINLSGFKVWPAEIEHYLYRMPGVLEVAVYGLAHPQKGEQVVAAVVPRAGARISAEDVIGYCRENLAAYKTPARVDIVESLPKSPTGKILKRVLREQG